MTQNKLPSVLLRSIFVENILLSFFLGMCSYLAVSKRVDSAIGLGVAVVTDTLRRLAADRRVVDGEFRPGASGTEWCSVEVLRRLRSRSLAALRQEVEPVGCDLGREMLAPRQAMEAVVENLEQPGFEAGARSEAVPGAQGQEGRVLDQIVGVVGMMQERLRVAPQAGDAALEVGEEVHQPRSAGPDRAAA
mgnify:CR=1 FL=1